MKNMRKLSGALLALLLVLLLGIGTFFGLYMLAFLAGRWTGTLLMVKFRPQDMLLVYALINVLLCIVVVCFGGWTGLYAMLN